MAGHDGKQLGNDKARSHLLGHGPMNSMLPNDAMMARLSDDELGLGRGKREKGSRPKGEQWDGQQPWWLGVQRCKADGR
ncbi:hypothetical protein NL676_012179 [Syzygium grande]|nr:hypothetical protein NL676_012179 [Syzygium grande]